MTLNLTEKQTASRERTLLVALLLSLWAPLATGIAVVLSHSTTQVADFIRRSVELVALFVSWAVFRYLARKPDLTPAVKIRLERTAGMCVAGALITSGLAMMVLALSRLSAFQPGGNVYPGLVIAVLGLITNSWFWRRYTLMTREHPNVIIDAQSHLYRAKALVDTCVIAALTAVAVSPAHPATRYIDILGSLGVAVYLVFSGVRTARTSLRTDVPEHFLRVEGGADQ